MFRKEFFLTIIIIRLTILGVTASIVAIKGKIQCTITQNDLDDLVTKIILRSFVMLIYSVVIREKEENYAYL